MSSSSPEESPPSYGSSSSSSPPSNSLSPSSSSSSSLPSNSSSSSSSSSSPPSNSSSSSSPPPPSPDGSDNSSTPPPPSPQDSQSNDKSAPPPSPQDSQSNNKSAPPPSPQDSQSNNRSAPPPSDGKSSSSPPPPSSNNKSPSPPKSSDSSNKISPPPPPPPLPPLSPPPHPPHSRVLSPPKHHKSPPSSKTSYGGSSSNQIAIIAGTIAGATLLLFMMIAFVVTCSRKKKRKSHNQMNYYRDESQGRSDYYNSGPHGNWGGQSNELAIKMPLSGQVSSEHNWPIAPPPPPLMMSSGEMSSANFSGPYLPPVPPPHPSMALGFNQSSFSYEDLAVATGSFCRENLLGQGGFGFVHKGILPNGKEVAVKSLKANSGQGEREFQAEVDIISRVHHRHLVSLVGYCIAGSQRMLVYEFVPNNTLEYHLHGLGRPVMDWPTRIKIALGAAKGFAYLHEDCHPRIIHRDIKVANILLDFNFEAKVADFGLAKLSSDNYTHVSTRIMGTFGYLAPEYASSGKLTQKSDVYSYGIVLLELITGRCPVDVSNDNDSLVDWARPILMHASNGGSYEELVDPRLEHNYDHQEMLRMVASAGSCIRHSARRRPRMSQIVRALEGDVSLDDLNEGMKYGHSAVFSSGSSEYDGSSSQIC